MLLWKSRSGKNTEIHLTTSTVKLKNIPTSEVCVTSSQVNNIKVVCEVKHVLEVIKKETLQITKINTNASFCTLMTLCTISSLQTGLGDTRK